MSRKCMTGNSVAEHKSHRVTYVCLFVTGLKQHFDGDFSAPLKWALKSGFPLGINCRKKELEYE